MPLPKQLQIAPHIVYQELDNEAVLLNLNNEQYYGLDEIGVRLWQLTEQGQNMDTIVQTLLAEYDVAATQLELDLSALITQMSHEGLIFIVTSPSEK